MDLDYDEESVELLSAGEGQRAALSSPVGPPGNSWRRWQSVVTCDACDPLSEYYALRVRAGRTRRRAKLPRLFYVVAAAQVRGRFIGTCDFYSSSYYYSL